MRRTLPLSLAACLLAAGCATNEQGGQLLGGLGGGAIGALAGHAVGGTTGAVIGGVLGATAGIVVGGAIGRNLDERDRQRAAEATQMALAQNLPYSPTPVYYAPPPPPPGITPSAPTPAVARTPPAAPPAPSVQWASDHSSASGNASIVAVQPASGARGECRTVHEIAYIGGEEVSQDQRYCRDTGNQWQKA